MAKTESRHLPMIALLIDFNYKRIIIGNYDRSNFRVRLKFAAVARNIRPILSAMRAMYCCTRAHILHQVAPGNEPICKTLSQQAVK
jgi:hypothetical protein